MSVVNKFNLQVIALKECTKFSHNAATLTTIHNNTATVYYFASGI